MTDELVQRMVAHAKEHTEIHNAFPRFCSAGETSIDGTYVQIGDLGELRNLFPGAELERSERMPGEYPWQYSISIDGVKFFCIEKE